MKQTRVKHDIGFLLLASFFYLASPMLVTPLIAGYAESLGAAATMMGVIGGLMNICALICRPIVGNLADKISKYNLSFVGAGLMVISCIGYILAWNPVCIIVARIVNGIGYSCCSVCMSTWMSNMLPKDKIGSGMGLYGTMNALAMAIAPAIGVSIYQKIGYQPAFLVAAISIALTVVSIQLIHDKGEPTLPDPEENTKTGKAWEIVDKNVIPVALIIMLFAIPYCATQSFLVSYVAKKQLHVTVSLFFPLYAAIIFILRLSLKNLFDKKPFSFFLILSSASAFISIAILTIMQNDLAMLLAAVFMAGGYGIMYSVCQSKAILLAGEGRRGLANSTFYVGLDLGMALGPILGGILYGHVNIIYFYPILAVTAPLTLLVYGISRRKTEINL